MKTASPRSLAEMNELCDQPIGPTEWVDVSQSTVDGFADVTRDHQWIHVDSVRSEAGPFGGTIAHGLLTLSFGPGFTAELIDFAGFSHSLNYGYEKVRFPHPLPTGTRVRMQAVVTDVRPVGEGTALVVIRQIFEAEGIEKPVCVADSVSYVTEA